MSEVETKVIESVEVVDQAQQAEASTQALESSTIDALKELVGVSASNFKPAEEAIIEDVSPEAKLAALKASMEAPKEEVKEVEAEVADSKEEVAQSEPKVLEFKDYLETVQDSKVLHKVDGKMVEIDLKDAIKQVLNDYSGHKTVDKRFTELDKEKKSFYNEKQTYESSQKNIIETLAKYRDSGDILGGYAYLGSLTGTPEHVVMEQILAAATPIIERRYSLSAQELEFEQLLAEKQYLAQKVEAESRQRKQEQAQREFEAKVTSLRETHSIDKDDWDLAFNELDSSIPEGEPITDKMVIARVNEKKAQMQTVTMVSNLASKYKLNESDANILKDIAKQYPQFTEKELDELVSQSISDLSKQETEKKLASKYAEKKHIPAEEPSENEALKEIERLKKLVGIMPE